MGIQQWFYSLPMRLRSLFRPHQADQELKEELREHLDQQIEANVAQGHVTRRSALLRFARSRRHHARSSSSAGTLEAGAFSRTLCRICVTASVN